jgi:hypothetical protein
MKHLTLGIYFADEEGNICSKRQIASNWSVTDEEILERDFNVNIMDEISNILVENLKLQLTSETIKEMLEEMKERM